MTAAHLGLLYGAWTALVAAVVCVGQVVGQSVATGVGAVWRRLGPWGTGDGDGRVRAAGPEEPAYAAYWWRQMWVDATTAAASGPRAVWRELTGAWLDRNVRHLFSGRRPDGSWVAAPFTRFFLAVFVAPGTAAGAVLGAVLAVAGLVAVLAVFALLLGLVWLGWAAAVPVLRGVERSRRLLRGIRVKCPYPGCYRPVPLALHPCPNCRAEHRSLRPGRYGALWHVCACGHRLPATRLTGGGRLTAHCPHCARWLPEAAGTTRVVHAPLVGGTSSGKTMLMTAMTEGLRTWARQGGLTVEYASADDRRTATDLTREVRDSGWAHATTGGQPRALMLLVSRGRRRRLLYLYDPMGESLSDAGRVRGQHYLAHADGVVLVADVLADPKVRGLLSPDDVRRVADARPSSQGPWETYQRLTGELAALTGRRSRLSVAAVVTKRDVIDQLSSLPVPGARTDEWLTEIGLGSLVRALGHDFRAARYWMVSAHAATCAGPLESELLRAAEPALWLLAASGLRVRAAGGPGRKSPGPESPGHERKYGAA
ncbi:TRAFAC clade GTPase domain-containing protein [Streptomyces sp. CRN 30]|uniref:TRAFAC clade GTPase domain-containing protein n=1 Tax=Streptomyces sp. CRN 30 TaxID=3075613 RepID=UPI002A800DD1|nr:hypothetical protein [Streptomyces sp. CRN 30]